MIYDTLTPSTVKKICDTFNAHSMCINEKYKTFRKANEYWHSDRDRMVGRFFKKYIGKHFVLLDREIIAYIDDIMVYRANRCSVYTTNPEESLQYRGKPVYLHHKTFLQVAGFRAVNEMYGSGYIEMDCYNVFGDSVQLRLTESNLRYMQFKEITEEEFERVANVFADDREEIPFKVTYFLDYEEMKKRHLLKSKALVQDTTTVMAKDAHEAAAMVKNAIEAERA